MTSLLLHTLHDVMGTIKKFTIGLFVFCCIVLHSILTYGQIGFSRQDSAFIKVQEQKYNQALSQRDQKTASQHLNEIALRFWSSNEYPRAIEYYEKSLQLLTGMENEIGTGKINSNLGLLYADLKNYETSIDYFRKSLAISRSLNIKEGMVQSLLNIARSLNALKRFDESIVILEEANSLARQIPNQDLMMDYLLKCYASLSETHERAGNPKQSRYYYDSYKIFLEKSKKADLDLLRNKIEVEKIRAEEAETQKKQKIQELLKKQFELKQAEIELIKSDSTFHELESSLSHFQLELLALQQKSEIDSLQAVHQQLNNQAAISKERNLKNILAIVALGFIVILFFIYRNYIVVKKARQILVEKNTAIELEKSRSDQLLLNILPAKVAAELKNNGYAKARYFKEVTVCFADIVGFTTIASVTDPQQLLEDLNTCFKAFDEIIARYDLEKIKTIGDCYMFAGGLPDEGKGNQIVDLIKAAKEMQAWLNAWNKEREGIGLARMDVRMGIHIGPVAAGVIGSKKFAYDVWGDTVNMAARLEQSGDIGRINISEESFQKVKDVFNCEYRRKISAKNKGLVDMYFVEN